MTRQGTGTAPSGIGDRTFNSFLAQLRFAQKPGNGVPAYTRWINRGLARGVAALCASWGWSANLVSAVSAVFSIVALLLLLLLPVGPLTGLFVAALLAAGYVLDSADGQVARVTETGSMAGEWLDHVIDAARTPAIHLCVAVGFVHLYGGGSWHWWIPLLYCVITASHFMSQILAEQLLRNTGAKGVPQEGSAPKPAREPDHPTSKKSVARSIVMLHTDTGVLCWLFLAWGFPPVFLVLYLLMFAASTLSAAVSMVRKFRVLEVAGRKAP